MQMYVVSKMSQLTSPSNRRKEYVDYEIDEVCSSFHDHPSTPLQSSPKESAYDLAMREIHGLKASLLDAELREEKHIAELDEAKANVALLMGAQRKHQEEKQSLMSSLITANSQNQKVQMEFEHFKAQLAEISLKQEKEREEKESLKASLSAATRRNETIEGELEELRAQLEREEEEERGRPESAASDENNDDNDDEEVRRLQSLLSEATSRYKRAESKLKEMAGHMKMQEKEQREQVEETTRNLQIAVSEIKKRNIIVEAELEDARARITTLQREAQQLQGDMRKQGKVVKDTEEQHVELPAVRDANMVPSVMAIDQIIVRKTSWGSKVIIALLVLWLGATYGILGLVYLTHNQRWYLPPDVIIV